MITLINNFTNEFIHLIVMVAPFFILGISIGAILESTANFNFIYKLLGKGKRSILYASVLGGLLPGCACATMPMAEGLLRKGAKLSTACAFIITSPLLAPQTVILTFALLGPTFTFGRIIAGMAGGIGFGLLTYFLESNQKVALPKETKENHCCSPEQTTPSFLKSFLSISKKLGFYFFIGLAIASILKVTVPTTLIPNTIGAHPILSYLIAAIIGIPIYICEGEELPITFTLLSLGLAAGPSFTFLLGAVGTCIPTLLFAQKILGKKPMIIYGIYWAIFAPTAGIIFSKFS